MDNSQVKLKVLHQEVWVEITMDIRVRLRTKLKKSNSVERQVKTMA
jgi:hypothetical protein